MNIAVSTSLFHIPVDRPLREMARRGFRREERTAAGVNLVGNIWQNERAQ